MAIPPYYSFIDPLLRVLARKSGPEKAAIIGDEVADLARLTPEEKNQMLSSGRHAVYANRIGWAHDRLKRLGFSESATRGHWQITPKGLEFIQKHPDVIPIANLRALAKVNRQIPISDITQADDMPTEGDDGEAEKSPEERIDAAVTELRESLVAELLSLIGMSSPAFFERLVLDLLHQIGYGVSRADLVTVGGAGDGGIDGIITLDKLGLEKVYVQAKRWQDTVGRPQIQAFYGALAGRRATKGVFITTSSFSNAAISYAEQVSDSLVLVDGQQLARLMIDHSVGVSPQRTGTISKTDSDYFEEA